MPVWSRHLGDPILASDRTRRVDFALFMVEAYRMTNSSTRLRRSSGARHPRRTRMPQAIELSLAKNSLSAATKQVRIISF